MTVTALEILAKKYPQLYLAPKEGMSQNPLYRAIVRKGMEYQGDLSHFTGSPEDSFSGEVTPVGEVVVVFLKHRSDFECFYRILAYKCEPVPVPSTTGAAFISGFTDWSKIRQHMAAYAAAGRTDTHEEFKRFTADPANFKGSLLLLSEGPYSALPAETTAYTHPEWLDISLKIRRYHELTHFVCRKTFPDQKYPVWDELLADCMGLLAATGEYDVSLAQAFLGIRSGSYVGGRLENYLPEFPDTDIVRHTTDAIYALQEECASFRKTNDDLYALMLHLQENAERLCNPLF